MVGLYRQHPHQPAELSNKTLCASHSALRRKFLRNFFRRRLFLCAVSAVPGPYPTMRRCLSASRKRLPNAWGVSWFHNVARDTPAAVRPRGRHRRTNDRHARRAVCSGRTGSSGTGAKPSISSAGPVAGPGDKRQTPRRRAGIPTKCGRTPSVNSQKSS